MSKIERTHLKKIPGLTVPEIYTKFEQYPHITNYVSTVALGIKFDLNSIVLFISSGSREPDQFAALTLKINNTSCLLFTTGKMVVVGARTEYDSRLSAHIYRILLEKIPQPYFVESTKKFIFQTSEEYTQFTDFKIQNIVGDTQIMLNPNVKTKKRIDLDLIDEYVGKTATSLNPEIFPGLRFSIERSPECPISKACLMAYIFSGAKVVIMGADVKEDIYISNDFLRKTIEPYLKQNSDPKQNYKEIMKVLNATQHTTKEPATQDKEDEDSCDDLTETLMFLESFI